MTSVPSPYIQRRSPRRVFFGWWLQVSATANKSAQLVRNRLQGKQAAVAAALSVDEGTVSRWKSDGRFDQLLTAIEALDLKVVPNNYRCVPEDDLRIVTLCARRYLEQMKPEELIVDVL